MPKNPEWPAYLSEWKMEKGVRNLSEYQAKRFGKAMVAGEVPLTSQEPLDDRISMLDDDPW